MRANRASAGKPFFSATRRCPVVSIPELTAALRPTDGSKMELLHADSATFGTVAWVRCGRNLTCRHRGLASIKENSIRERQLGELHLKKLTLWMRRPRHMSMTWPG